MSDKVDKEEEEKVRTFHSPQDEQHSCFTHEALKTANSNRTNIYKETQMAPTVPIVHLNVLKWQEYSLMNCWEKISCKI